MLSPAPFTLKPLSILSINSRVPPPCKGYATACMASPRVDNNHEQPINGWHRPDGIGTLHDARRATPPPPTSVENAFLYAAWKRMNQSCIGEAQCKFKGGLRYTGRMLNGEFHGKGKLVFGKTGGWYEGSYRLGRQASPAAV